MNTKEAIKFLEECQDEIIDLQEKGHDELLIKVIKLLQRGEKYEAMWEEDAKNWLGNDLDLEEWMNETKQKYFPKKVIK